MDTRSHVNKFIARCANISEEDVTNNMDVVTDIDWSKVHEDEFTFFVTDFIREFNIYVPQDDFRKYAADKKIPWFLYPLHYWQFKFRTEAWEVDALTVREMIEIADAGVWDV